MSYQSQKHPPPTSHFSHKTSYKSPLQSRSSNDHNSYFTHAKPTPTPAENDLSYYLNLPKENPNDITKNSRISSFHDNISSINQENHPNSSFAHTPRSIPTSKYQSTTPMRTRQNSQTKKSPQGNRLDTDMSNGSVMSPRVSLYNLNNSAQTHLLKTPPHPSKKVAASPGRLLANSRVENFISPSQQQSLLHQRRLQTSPGSHYYSKSEQVPQQEQGYCSRCNTQSSVEVSPMKGKAGVPVYETAKKPPKVQSPWSFKQQRNREDPYSLMGNNALRSSRDMGFEDVSRRILTSESQQQSCWSVKYEEIDWENIDEEMGNEEMIRLIMRLQKDLQGKDEEAARLEERNRREEEENMRIMRQIEEMGEMIVRNEEELKDLNGRCVIQENEIESQRKYKEKLEKDLREFGGKTREFKEWTKRAREVRENMEKANTEVFELSIKYERMQKEAAMARENEQKKQKENIEKIEKEVMEKEDEIESLEREIKELKEKEKECRLMDEKFQELEEMQRELMEENEALKEFVKLCHTRKEHLNSLKVYQEQRQKQDEKEREESGKDLIEMKRRLTEMDSYTDKILKIFEVTRKGLDIPIELILPHNRLLKNNEKRVRFEDEPAGFDLTEINRIAEDNLQLTESLKKKLEKGIEDIMEEYHHNS